MNDIQQIKDHENQLKQAMLRSDIETLDRLLSQDLIFTNHLGQCITKQDDLSAHESGLFKINEIVLSDQRIFIFSDSAVVVVHARIMGGIPDKPSDNNFCFTRVWKKYENNNWQVIVGHSTIVV